MIRLVVELPREQCAVRRITSLDVRTAQNSLLVAQVSGDEKPWFYHADHLHRRIRGYERQRQRLAQDNKEERRSPQSERPRIVGRVETLARKHHRFAESELRRASAYLVGFAMRRRVATVTYDDCARGYVGVFPLHELARMIREACEREGIEYRHLDTASGDAETNRKAG